MDTSIRIEVPAAIYNQLVRIQEKRRQAEGRKPSLSSIILDFCSSCINDDQTSSKNVQSAGNSVQNNAADVQNTRLFQSEETMLKRLARWEESLSRWEANLTGKENRLKECERDLSVQREEIFQSKLEILDQRDLSRKAALAGPEEIIENKMMSLEISNKDEKIKRLKETISKLEEDLQKAISAAKPVKETSSFMNIIKDYWPLIVAGAGMLITYFMKQKTESKKQNVQIGQLLKSLEKLGDVEK
ncbi:MAG: hypothetical protein A2W93_02235 [Bacteroidetes bacterium GWF2_43_63]|nr:MAG: hypothetical protein A2W93_02235 [Bacteroidetes bacterium GWF2_43_63]HBG69283.1 hypothetical protein [Bacteroidales bacterium]HCB60337.1 hypothetical protein [Bacteroidales bacterium]HCY23676.1 hypothetical protein [Bacteroidales bacterium]